ncbi:Tat (twin-arginine translocation) pathway signal sequence containing protein [Aestuariivivens sediminicola]|uniref:Tat (twin-arginine translocation) pathway signal sequence containing protein n=1 Tax=Aestuariivivens sediminicola TaxID=2913560 RepID=UPI001F5AFC33|nr:Tat (twin-arginine translocation) pathway signal sequence containing protein [Aestuariivivens sediminicola]
MKTKDQNTRRKFFSQLTTGAVAAAGLAFVPQAMRAQAGMNRHAIDLNNSSHSGSTANAVLKGIGQKEHPLAYDMSSVNPWGLMWSNVYYITNKETGTSESRLGILNVLRHHGMIFAMNDATIRKYELGEFFGLIDPITNKPAVRNPYYTPEEGVFPIPGLSGIKGLQDKGTTFFVCDMARKVYAQFVGKKRGVDPEIVYKDFVKGTLPGIVASPSGVWALGRLAENNIAYIDASIG